MSQTRRYDISEFNQFENLIFESVESREIDLGYEGVNIPHYFRETNERRARMALHVLEVPDKIRDLILTGSIDGYPSRSERDWAISCHLLAPFRSRRLPYSLETIIAIFTNRFYGCSDRIREKGPDFLVDEIRRVIAKTENDYGTGPNSDETNVVRQQPQHIPHTPIITPLESIEPRSVRWLWPNRIPLGKLSLLVGDPGEGKSFLSMYIATHVTRRENWPDIESPSPHGSVIIMTAEDGLADTIRIRADSAGADVSKIRILEGVLNRDEEREYFNLNEHLSALEYTIENTEDLRLVIIDPITAYLGMLDTHKNSLVRGTLAPIASLAERYEVAVVAISHLNKNKANDAIYRTMGSLAFVAAARAVWAVSRDINDESRDRRFLTPLKTNLSINPTTLAFRIVDNRIIFEDQPVEINPEDVLSNERRGETSVLGQAVGWLREALEDGPIPSADMDRMARENHISIATLRRAKDRLGVESYKEGIGLDGRWFWRLLRERGS